MKERDKIRNKKREGESTFQTFKPFMFEYLPSHSFLRRNSFLIPIPNGIRFNKMKARTF